MHPFAGLRQPEQADHLALFLEILEQTPDAFEIGQRRRALERMCLAAHDQPLLVRLLAGPGRQADSTTLAVSSSSSRRMTSASSRI